MLQLLYKVEFPVGQELAASATHLLPSIEVHLMIMYGCACSHALITERPT